MMRTRADWLGPTLNRSLELDFSVGFQFGRVTAETCTPPALPNAERSCDAVKDNFIDSLGLTWKESAALMGVHTLGRAHKQFSGYEGWWSPGEAGRTFNVSYYVTMLAGGWEPKNIGPGKNLWIRSDGGSPFEMMLSSDICLLYDTPNNASAASDLASGCCVWTDEGDNGLGSIASLCHGGVPTTENCCDADKTCNDELYPNGPAASAVKLFASNETAWLETFVTAWRK
eukprot:988352-Prymnesium_polylepis.1